MNDYTITAGGLLSYSSFLISLEIFARKLSLPAEFTRRLAHIVSALFIAFFSIFLSGPFLVIPMIFFSLVMFLSRLLKIFNHIHNVSRPTFGEELLPLGFVVAYLISKGNITIFIPSVLVVGLADPFTGMIAEKYGKNLYGFLTFAAIAIPVLLFFSVPFPASIFIASVVASIERVSPFGSDNLFVPIGTALLLTFV